MRHSVWGQFRMYLIELHNQWGDWGPSTFSSLTKDWEPLSSEEVAHWIPDVLTWCDLQFSKLSLGNPSWLECSFSPSPLGRTLCFFKVKSQFSFPLNSSIATVNRVGSFSPSDPGAHSDKHLSYPMPSTLPAFVSVWNYYLGGFGEPGLGVSHHHLWIYMEWKSILGLIGKFQTTLFNHAK